MSMTCSKIFSFLEDFAPLSLAEEWDNVGLQLGDPRASVQRALISLDVDERVCKEAEEKGVELIISHHPLIFKPMKKINLALPDGALLARLIRAGIAVYSAHTNLDSAVGGVNAVLAEKLGLHNVEVLIPDTHQKFIKLVVFVPSSHVATVRSAIGSAGGGWIGNYSDCTFELKGTGAFRPLEGTNPYIGKTGELKMVEEIRLETILPAHKVDHVIGAMLQAHPYEEVAYDLYQLENRGYSPVGLGRVGNLPEPMPFRELVQLVKKNLFLTSVRLGGGEPDKKVQRVAVCGGSGANLWSKARSAGAEILITGDVGYHAAKDMHAAGLGFIDAGHYGTEIVILPVLRDYLAGRCKKEEMNLELFLSESNYDPFVFF